MSRVARKPIDIPAGVEVSIGNNKLDIKGNLGEMRIDLHPLVSISQSDNQLIFSVKNVAEKNKVKAWTQAGSARANVNNCIIGVSEGFERRLKLVGVGYRAKVFAKKLELLLGFSHPINYDFPDDVSIETPSQNEIVIKGCDKQKVGQVAANIRAYRPPEPYKGKGVCYTDEVIFRKEAKKK